MRSLHRILFLALPFATWGGLVPNVGAADKPPPSARRGRTDGRVDVSHVEFHGWKAIALRSRGAEVVVVPAIGRVMRFDLLDEDGGTRSGPFWNHPKISSDIDQTGGGAGGTAQTTGTDASHRPRPDTEGWTNYGGDKAWPAPQSEWSTITGRGWPPPKGFDALPYMASIKNDKVQLVSAVDPDYGIRVRRTIALDPSRPVMTVETTYEKVRGRSVSVGVWTITQLDAPDRLFVLLPARHESAAFALGYNSLLPHTPQSLNIDGRILSLGHDRHNKTMLNSDGRALLWVGSGPDLLIEDKTPGRPGNADEWPSLGAHSQVYTSPGPNPDNKIVPPEDAQSYVELELLGRLNKVGGGSTALMRTSYTLIRRTEQDPLLEAKKVFARP